VWVSEIWQIFGGVKNVRKLFCCLRRVIPLLKQRPNVAFQNEQCGAGRKISNSPSNWIASPSWSIFLVVLIACASPCVSFASSGSAQKKIF